MIAFSFNFFTRLRQEFILREAGCYIVNKPPSETAPTFNGGIGAQLYLIDDEFSIQDNDNYRPFSQLQSSNQTQ